MLCHWEFMAAWAPPTLKLRPRGCVLSFGWSIWSAPGMLADVAESKSVPRSRQGSPDVFFPICLSVLLNPADPLGYWRSLWFPLRGPVGDSSHLGEVLNQNIFSGSSWECAVIKERGRRSSWRPSLVVTPLLCVISYPDHQPDSSALIHRHTHINVFIYFAAGLLLTIKNIQKVKGQLSTPSQQGFLALYASSR